jgi:phosphoadenosine phosphosulfate reductase
MSIHDPGLFGMSKHETAIARIREFCQGQTVLCAFSGGKDSQCCYHLLEESGVEFHAEYSITRFEPPELMQFIRQHYPAVTFRRAYKMNLIAEVEYSGLPNMWARWCCKAKHVKTPGFNMTVIGVRADESANRKANWRMVGIKQDGVKYLCPIIDWSTSEVWEYLANRPHCSLYDEGYKRIGCVCCPLCPDKMIEESIRWPKTAAVLRKGSDAFVARMRSRGWVAKSGKHCADWCEATTPEVEYWRRWVSTGQTAKSSLDEHSEELPCLFEGTGFSNADEGSEI